MVSNQPPPEWVVEPGPHGHGDCLVGYIGSKLQLVAPPGTPLERPEVIQRLLRWRRGTLVNGVLRGAPTILSMADAVKVAPDQAEWVEAQQDEYERRELQSKPDAGTWLDVVRNSSAL